MLRKIKGFIENLKNIFMQLRWFAKLGVFLILALIVSLGGVLVSGTPGFCNSCHIMNPYYDNWKVSAHSEVNCLDCHLQPGLVGYVKGKVTGLAQAVDCGVGRVGTKPSATVMDISCLRSGCHSIEELSSEILDFNGVKFAHKIHVGKEVDGVHISCGTCHSHFKGDEHFRVNTQVCFTCHFLKADEKEKRLVQTDCLTCHQVPDQVIKRGIVWVYHA